MKLTSNPESRNFWGTVMGYDKRIVCLLDGKPLEDVYEADTEEGYAVVYIVENGELKLDPKSGEPVMRWLFGKVEISRDD